MDGQIDTLSCHLGGYQDTQNIVTDQRILHILQHPFLSDKHVQSFNSS